MVRSLRRAFPIHVDSRGFETGSRSLLDWRQSTHDAVRESGPLASPARGRGTCWTGPARIHPLSSGRLTGSSTRQVAKPDRSAETASSWTSSRTGGATLSLKSVGVTVSLPGHRPGLGQDHVVRAFRTANSVHAAAFSATVNTWTTGLPTATPTYSVQKWMGKKSGTSLPPQQLVRPRVWDQLGFNIRWSL
jgi:hypothetical protein